MLIGEYRHSIDQKGRVAVPADFRHAFDTQGGVVTIGLDGCLFFYTRNSWEKWVDRIKNLSVTNRDARAFARVMLGRAHEVRLDSQGRINIPNYLLEAADLEGKAVLVGVNDRVEIWNEENWDEYREDKEANKDDIAAKLEDFDL